MLNSALNVNRCLRAVALGIVLLLGSRPTIGLADDDTEFFEKQIRPILVQRCEKCHSTAKGKTHGGLSLDSQLGWKTGGDSGPAIIPGKVDESLLIQAIRYADDGPQMPPEEAGGKLPDAEVALLTQWVQRGAPDPRTADSRRGGLTENELRQWWSFQPLGAAPVPAVSDAASIRNEIDNFVQARLEAEGLARSPEADRQTLIRRATYDLTGLPPTPEEVAAFLADSSPRAYETLVDRLLESPRYGERWGRHWLDLVRYADTAGENSDHPIPQAWRYRNWVIDAFNRDLPYDVFIREQIAGDLLHANDSAEQYAAGVVATGFLAIARRFDHDSDKHMHLTFEDTIDTTGRSFLGLSIACARCHDHKFDPISAKDYYALYGILNSTRFAFPGCEAKQQPRDLVPMLSQAEWEKTIVPYDKQLAELNAEIKSAADSMAAQSSQFKSAATTGSSQTLARGVIADGGSQSFQDAPGQTLGTIDVKAGQMVQLTVDPQSNYGADTTLIEWTISEIGGSGRQWNLTQDVAADFLAANPHADRLGNPAVWLFLDGRGGPSLLSETVRDAVGKPGLHVWRNGENPAVMVNSTAESIPVWTMLPPGSVLVHPALDGPVAIAWVSPIDGQVSLSGRIVDAHPGGPDGVGWTIDLVSGNLSTALGQFATASTQRTQLAARKADLESHAPAREVAYGVTEGAIADARLQLRGDPEKLGEEVPRRWLELFGGQSLPAGAGSGRLQLAQWLSDRANPLVARVMVNRIWQHHFGKGLVQSPNDFGTRGQRPTHPELLDWLASQFLERGWSIKSMHRVMMLSAAYLRSSGAPAADGDREQTLAVDPANNLCWRFDRRRLSAEELRDSLLVASQQIDLSPGGAHPIPPSAGWSYTQHVPFAGLAESDKRTVYQLTLRNRRPPFMSLFDGSDPNAPTAQRQVTTVPTQSLYFMNDPFFHAQAEKVARRVLDRADDNSRLDGLFQIVLQRSPTESERAAMASFLTQYAAAIADTPPADQPLAVWSACSRVLLSSNQFLYVE